MHTTIRIHVAAAPSLYQRISSREEEDSSPGPVTGCPNATIQLHDYRVAEICYNIRYFATHGRDGVKSRWSERQTGIYHNLRENRDPKLISSQLITVQLPEQIRHRLDSIATNKDAAKGSINKDDGWELHHHLGYHLVVFFGLAADWRAYLCFLEGLLDTLETPALNTKVGLHYRRETHILTFNNAQGLEKLRRKIIKARHMLTQNSEVVRRWIEAAEQLLLTLRRPQRDHDEVTAIIASARGHLVDLDCHIAASNLLLERVCGTEKLIYHILAYKNEEQVIQSTMPLNSSSEKLLLQLRQLSSRHDSVYEIASDFASDSKWVKILTFITMLYAPASFAAF
ncbi:hypothetical protein V8F20_010226 [Naviculisporaceae sp. PSN 640]